MHGPELKAHKRFPEESNAFLCEKSGARGNAFYICCYKHTNRQQQQQTGSSAKYINYPVSTEAYGFQAFSAFV